MMKSNHFVLAAGLLLAASTCAMAGAAYAGDEDEHESSRAAHHEHEAQHRGASHDQEASHDGGGDMAPGASRPLTLSNTGTKPLEIDIRFMGNDPRDFSQTSNCGERLAGQGSCVINVIFAPRTPGKKSATMEIHTSGGTKYVYLTGVGV